MGGGKSKQKYRPSGVGIFQSCSILSYYFRQEIVNVDFTTQDIIILIGSAAVGIWYFLKKHWVANNLFGLAFAINGVELLHLNKVVTGCILLGGLFFYDIFWVFGTNVMVTVAKSFEAPIKLVFPQDLLENGLSAQVCLVDAYFMVKRKVELGCGVG